MGRLDIVFESFYTPYSEIESRLVEGKLDAFDAHWSFKDVEGEGVLVEYAIHIKPAGPSPRLLVRHYLRRRLPDLVACLRGLSQASGSAAQARADLGRCPGDADASATAATQ
jgi:hypothetical protein